MVTTNNNKNSKEEAKEQPFPYEFGGPIGAAVTIFSLPIVILLLAHWSDVGGIDFAFLSTDFGNNGEPFWNAIKNSEVLCPGCANPDLLSRCTGILLGWFSFQVLLERFLPCELVEGSPIQGSKGNKLRLTYRINGHLAFWVTLLVVAAVWPVWHEASQTVQFTAAPLPELLPYDNFASLAFCTIALCFALSLYLYLDSFRSAGTSSSGDDKILAKGGNSGNAVYDFFIGRELNPRLSMLPNFDWKEFCELRPGLIGWMLLNLSSLQQQQKNLGYVTGSMMLLCVFQGIYVWDALYQERAILTTMDITTDGFGYMLVLGDLAWVPFTYSLQARYLVKHDPHLSFLQLSAILIFHIAGYLIFRGANSQKDLFRRNPDDQALAHLTFLQTRRGTKLLTAGWWGLARKINYTGDYIMGLTWCLLAGFDSIVPYFYAVYFLILLIHRSIRDDHICQAKYGEDWDTYKKLVPYRFIPGVY